MATLQEQKELLKSPEFEQALIEGAECKKTIVTTYKEQNKANYERFYDVMLDANEEIQRILDKKKKNRTEDDEKKLKDFKKSVGQMYKQAQDLMIKEKLEEGKPTRTQKILDKIVPVIHILKYIGNQDFFDELDKRGITINAGAKLEDRYKKLDSDEKRAVMRDIFNNAKNVKQKMVDDADKISNEIYQGKVPIDLQYDKDMNHTGMKQSDFVKLVDMKMKLIMANSDEAKEKVEEDIDNLACEKQFEVARAELVRDSLTGLQ